MRIILHFARPVVVAMLSLIPAGPVTAAPELHEAEGLAVINWQGDPIVELQGYRKLRFRSLGDNERWLGTRISRMDLCWDYSGINDYVYRTRRFDATDRGFVLEIEAEKPSVRGTVRTRIEGVLVSPTQGFAYTLSSQLSASESAWREQSGARGRDPDQPMRLEMLDYHVNRISQADIFTPGATPGMTELYDAIALSDDGQDWRLLPKIPLPRITRVGAGNFPTETWEGKGATGQRLAFLDRREGGWDIELKSASAPLQYEMCWMYYDVHHYLEGGVPVRQPGKDTFQAHYSLYFRPLTPAAARELLAAGQPIEWRSRPEYQLPVFGRYNTFDRLIAKNSEYPWFATDDRCTVDFDVGYDDRGSARIRNTDAGQKSAWYAWTWGSVFDQHSPLEGTYRFSALVRTQGCEAPVRLAVVEFLHDIWPEKDGTLVSPKRGMWHAVAEKNDRWHYSTEAVSGTSDWTRLTLDLKIDNDQFRPNRPESPKRGVVLQYHGKGTVWFDNVRIERIE